MTDIFIYVYFGALVIYDCFLYARKKKTITEYMRKWYEETFIIPYAAGVIFLGHFPNLYQLDMVKWGSSLALFGTGTIAMVISILMKKYNYTWTPRGLVFIPIACGMVLGDLLW